MPHTARYGVYIFAAQGYALAARLVACLPTALYAPSSLRAHPALSLCSHVVWFDRLSTLLQSSFFAHSIHVFFAATGLVVRAIAPFIHSKDSDPAVVIADHLGMYVICLLSGHLGGGNAATRIVAECLGATPIITTATDLHSLPAIDLLAQERGLSIANISAVKAVSAALLAGQRVSLIDSADHLGLQEGLSSSPFFFRPATPSRDAIHDALSRRTDPATPSSEPGSAPAGSASVLVSEFLPAHFPPDERRLILHPRTLAVGIGCRRGASAEYILAAVRQILLHANLAPASLFCLASHAIKANDDGLVTAARVLELPLRLFDSLTLSRFPVTLPSEKVMKLIGVAGVCEPAALAAASMEKGGAELVIPKQTLQGVTVAVARLCPASSAEGLFIS